MIKKSTKDFVDTLVEICVNVIKGNVPLNPTQFRRLKRFHKQLKAVTLKKTSQTKRKQIFQRGGFLGALLKPILGLLLQ